MSVIMWILVIITIMAAGYSLSMVCVLRNLDRDPRHASFSVFVLLAQALMEITGLVSPVNLRESPDYMMGWFIVGVATVILITWHVVIATKVRRKPDVL